jgi:hypothetical protein
MMHFTFKWDEVCLDCDKGGLGFGEWSLMFLCWADGVGGCL